MYESVLVALRSVLIRLYLWFVDIIMYFKKISGLKQMFLCCLFYFCAPTVRGGSSISSREFQYICVSKELSITSLTDTLCRMHQGQYSPYLFTSVASAIEIEEFLFPFSTSGKAGTFEIIRTEFIEKKIDETQMGQERRQKCSFSLLIIHFIALNFIR